MISLAAALRLVEHRCVGFSGAGGKTTTIFYLGREVVSAPAGLAIATTTTHLGREQARLADWHEVVLPGAPLAWSDRVGLGLLSGPLNPDERWTGLDAAQFAALYEATGQVGAALLVEADGSRRMPVKAPAAHEPALPEQCQMGVTVAGMSALGQAIGPQVVQRMERFCELSESQPGDALTPERLAAVLTHPQGGLKGQSALARRALLLNQVDAAPVEPVAALARLCLGAYDVVIEAALGNPAAGLRAVHEPVAGIVLAAGGSQRMGQPKQLLTWRGEPLVRHVARQALAGGLSPVRVVVGARADEVAAALVGLPVEVVVNTAWEQGQATSLGAGLVNLPQRTGGAVFLLADQPQVTADLVQALTNRYCARQADIVIPRVHGQRTNPVLFGRALFADLSKLQGDTGGRALFGRYPLDWLDWPDEGLLADLDTLEEYQLWLKRNP